MLKYSFIYLGLIMLLVVSCQNSNSENQASTEPSKDELAVAEETYQIYCASCHGLNMEGASAEGLIKTEWQYGGTQDSLFTSIQKGIPAVSMPAYEHMIEEEKIEALVEYILEAQKESSSGQ